MRFTVIPWLVDLLPVPHSEISIVFSAILMPIGDHDAISGNAGQSAKQFEWKLMDSYDATKGRGVPTC